jgi:hypothetical protein
MAYNQSTQGTSLSGGLAVEDSKADNGASVPRTSIVTMTASTGAGNALAWQNASGGRIIVLSVAIDITTASEAATTIDVGVASSATTDDTLIDGKTTATAAVINSADDGGTNGAMARAVASDYYVTGSITGTIGSFAGKAYITWVPITV